MNPSAFSTLLLTYNRIQEEEHERYAMAEAEQFKAWQKVLGVKKRLANAARRRSLIELRAALDLAGQVR